LFIIQIIGYIAVQGDNQIRERKNDEGYRYEWMSPDLVRTSNIRLTSTQQKDPDRSHPISHPGDEHEHISQHIERTGQDE
jgi:hypothetical protein